jgi:trans-aconitate 2-methyltransferase
VTASQAWDPQQYTRFEAERAQPFFDLAGLLERDAAMRVADLGCGTGRLTAWLHGELGAVETVGVDASEAMLEQSREHAGGALRFERGDIASWAPEQAFDLVFSNAALQWVEDHEALWVRLAAAVRAGGQLAVQMPANDEHPSHVIARALAQQEPYREHLDGYVRRFPTLVPARYAALLDELGFERQHVRVQVYGHRLPNARAVVEWVKGSLLTAYRDRLPADVYARFLEDYTALLLAELGEREPYFYAFPRILMWGRKAG